MNKAAITFDRKKALELAGTFKSHATIEYRQLRSKFELGSILAQEPECVIMEGAPPFSARIPLYHGADLQ